MSEEEATVYNELTDSTKFLVKVNVVSGENTVLTKEMTITTPDRTGPAITNMTILNSTLQVQAADNVQLAAQPYMFTVAESANVSYNSLGKIILMSSENTIPKLGVWTDDSTLPSVKKGDKIASLYKDEGNEEGKFLNSQIFRQYDI